MTSSGLRWARLSANSSGVRSAVAVVVLVCAALAGYKASPRLLAAILGVAALALMLRRPAWGLAILAAAAMTVPFDVQASTVVRVNIAVFMVPLLFAIWVLDMVRRRALYLAPSAINAPSIAFVLAATLSWVLGNAYWDPLVPRPHNIVLVQLGQWSIYAFSMIALWLAANLLTNSRALKLTTYTYLAVGGMLAILYAIPASEPLAAKITAVGAAYSPYWVWVTALAGGQLLFNRRLSLPGKLFCLFTTVALWGLAVFRLNFWLSGLLPMAVVAAVLIGLRFRRKGLWILLAVGLLLWANFTPIYNFLGGDSELQSSGGGRLEHQKLVLDLALRRPWFGLGMAAYRHYSWTIPDQIAAALYRGAPISSHNNYLDIFANMGAVGLAVFAWLLAAIGRLAWRVRRHVALAGGFDSAYANAVLAGLAGTLVSGLLGEWFLPFVYNVGFAGFRSSVMIWIFCGGMVALDTMSRASVSSGQPQTSEV